MFRGRLLLVPEGLSLKGNPWGLGGRRSGFSSQTWGSSEPPALLRGMGISPPLLLACSLYQPLSGGCVMSLGRGLLPSLLPSDASGPLHLLLLSWSPPVGDCMAAPSLPSDLCSDASCQGTFPDLPAQSLTLFSVICHLALFSCWRTRQFKRRFCLFTVSPSTKAGPFAPICMPCT